MCGFFFFFVYICYSKNKLYVPIYSKIPFRLAIALLLLVVAVVNALMGMLSKENLLLVTERLLFWINRSYSTVSRIDSLFRFSLGFASLGQMADKALRLTSLEHP
jgi:hypothetical protein